MENILNTLPDTHISNETLLIYKENIEIFNKFNQKVIHKPLPKQEPLPKIEQPLPPKQEPQQPKQEIYLALRLRFAEAHSLFLRALCRARQYAPHKSVSEPDYYSNVPLPISLSLGPYRFATG